MQTLADIAGPDDYLRLPRIENADVRLLWHTDYWDGPRSGMLIYHGEECWFQVIAESKEDDTSSYRRFIILRLSPEQHAEECSWHQLFQDKVGHHADYDKQNNRPSMGILQPRDQWHEFYEPYKQRTAPSYAANEVLGWFER